MNCFPEAFLRKKADRPTLRMLNCWKTLCHEKIGSIIEVVITSRREYQYYGINTFNGELNTAMIQPHGDRLLLVLMLESVENLNMVVITHELGHWVLRLQGLKEIVNKNGTRYEYLGSLCTHPSLYKLQRSFGHEPQKEIDKRTAYNIAKLRTKTESTNREDNIEKALYYADDLLNCSKSNSIGLQRALSKKFPRTASFVDKILDLASSRDLSKIEEVLPFSREIVQDLGLEGNWIESNDLQQLKDDIARLE